MYIPATYSAALLMLLTSMFCWGSWANTAKVAKGYRFELFYWDYMLGLGAAVVGYGFLLGGPFLADLGSASGRYLALAAASGVIFNIANVLLVAAIEIAGLAVAFPISIGLALILGASGNYIVAPRGNPLFLFGGVAFVALAIFFDALAYRGLTAGAAVSRKGIGISLASGVLMGSFYPFFARATATSDPQALGPYVGSLAFVAGAWLCHIPLNSFLMLRASVPFSAYFGARARWHLLGLLGGVIWCTGTVFNFVASTAGLVGPAVSYALGQGATMVSAIWGVFVWREFRGAGPTVLRRLGWMFLFFLTGLTLVALAPLV